MPKSFYPHKSQNYALYAPVLLTKIANKKPLFSQQTPIKILRNFNKILVAGKYPAAQFPTAESINTGILHGIFYPSFLALHTTNPLVFWHFTPPAHHKT